MSDQARSFDPESWQLFAVWAARNVSYLSLVVADPDALNLWQVPAVTVVGNLFWGASRPARDQRSGLGPPRPTRITVA